MALQIIALRKKAGLSQKELARLLKTSQQQISRLESSGYEGHSLSMLRRFAEALHARVRVVFEPFPDGSGLHVAEGGAVYMVEKRIKSAPAVLELVDKDAKGLAGKSKK